MAAYTDYTARLGARIRFLRKSAGLSLRTFGLMIGIHHNQILLIEQGKTNPSLQTLLRIADGLDVALADLLPDDKGVDAATAYWFPRENGGQDGRAQSGGDEPEIYGKGEGPLPRG